MESGLTLECGFPSGRAAHGEEPLLGDFAILAAALLWAAWRISVTGTAAVWRSGARCGEV